jgi:hypothetical protein
MNNKKKRERERERREAQHWVPKKKKTPMLDELH